MTVESAVLSALTPSGQDLSIPMNDAGVDGDLVEGDGIFGAQLPLEAVGNYVLMPTLLALSGAEVGTEFVRSSQHVVAVSKARLALKGSATLRRLASGRSLVALEVDVQAPVGTLRAYTEVYARQEDDGAETPVAWLGGLVELQEDGTVTLEFDHDWLALAGLAQDGALPQLVLRNTYLADTRTTFPVALYAEAIAVTNPTLVRFITRPSRPLDAVTREMRLGVDPFTLSNRMATGKTGLVLLPGYCADKNPWERSRADFGPDAYFFDEFKLNEPHADYALKVLKFVERNGLDSFSLIGHSQGGKVALHIYNYYWSGLDNSTGGRKIQSVGTPWEGSSGAGCVASLGNMFGIGCGANSDLTRDGARNWRTGILKENEEDVFFFTTTYEQGSWFGDSCSFAMNLVLSWPNDGVTELPYAKLSGGQSQGNTPKWCHTTDMNYPAQYDDHERNRQMTTLAAR